MPPTEPSPHERIEQLLSTVPSAMPEIARILGIPESATLIETIRQRANWTPGELVEIAEALRVPSAVLAGRLPMDRHLGVSLRLGVLTEPGAPAEALQRAERLFDDKAVLDSWLGPVRSPLASVPMSSDTYHMRAGQTSAERVRDALRLGDEPVNDLVGLVESQGVPTFFTHLPEDVFGLNIRDERDSGVSRVIVVSTVGPWTMQRYTLAHELCHALYDDAGQLIVDRVDIPEVLAELRAESFARHLLLPKSGLAREVRAARRSGDGWDVVVARTMIRWGVSRKVAVRALLDDGLAGNEDLEGVERTRVDDLMAAAQLTHTWSLLSDGESEPSGSPMLVERAVAAYGNGWVSLQFVADLLGVTEEQAEAQLAAAGWGPPNGSDRTGGSD